MSNFYFPTEILNQVLLKLPMKSLIRFTSVCKSWQSLITSPMFISSHLSSTENHVILWCYENHDRRKHFSLLKFTENGLDTFSELEFPFKSEIRAYRTVGTCHGLVCLSYDHTLKHVIIWNPSVKNHVVIPTPVLHSEEPHRIVLGFGVADHVYKVVRLVYYGDDKDYYFTAPPQAEVFSLGTGRWRKVEAFHLTLKGFTCRQVLMKGIVHWLAFDDKHGHSSILTFEFGYEVFSEVMLPNELARFLVTNLSIFMIDESLGVGVIKAGGNNTSYDVWTMNEYGVKESWTKLYTIDFHFRFRVKKLVRFCRSGEALFDTYNLETRQDELVAYIPKTTQIMNLGIYGYTWSFYFDNYAESLLLLRGYTGVSGESS